MSFSKLFIVIISGVVLLLLNSRSKYLIFIVESNPHFSECDENN